MSQVGLTFLGLLAYVCGIVMITVITPRILKHQYDELRFMGYAAADIIGGLFVFAPVAVTFGLFNGAFAVRVLDFLLLVGIIILGASMARRSLRPRFPQGTFLVSRMLSGGYAVLLLALACFALILLFIPAS